MGYDIWNSRKYCRAYLRPGRHGIDGPSFERQGLAAKLDWIRATRVEDLEINLSC